MSRPTPRRGEVWSVHLDPTTGHEQGGARPALVVSDDRFNASPADMVVVLPITGTDRGLAAHVRIPAGEGGLTKPSLIMADQVRTVAKARLGRRWGAVEAATMAEVEDRLRFLLSL